jgi:hypothetical protein
LMQYIWLAMKDRPPFKLRAHRELFALINTRFHIKMIHMFDEMMPESPSYSYAKVLIDYFKGAEDIDKSALEFLNYYAEVLLNTDPVATIRLRSLFNLVQLSGHDQKENWKHISELAARVLEWHNRIGEFKDLGLCMDIPFYYLNADTSDCLEEKEDFLEAYRCAGIWYWLMVTASDRSINLPEATALLDEEKLLLDELRGARFIRLLPHLPLHYRRYGVSIDEAMGMKPPEGAEPKENGLLHFDPFDQDLAIKELKEATSRLFALFNRMDGTIPEYSAARKKPNTSIDKFIELLNDHRC